MGFEDVRNQRLSAIVKYMEVRKAGVTHFDLVGYITQTFGVTVNKAVEYMYALQAQKRIFVNRSDNLYYPGFQTADKLKKE